MVNSSLLFRLLDPTWPAPVVVFVIVVIDRSIAASSPPVIRILLGLIIRVGVSWWLSRTFGSNDEPPPLGRWSEDVRAGGTGGNVGE